MKYIITLFSLLILLISGVLFFQYQVFSDREESKQGDFFYTQEIDIVYRNGSLDIRHQFKNLPNQTININWPGQAGHRDCFMDGENSCKRLSEDHKQFTASDIRTQSISYIIPIQGGLKSNQLFHDIFATLENGHVTHSIVHITTDSSINGEWVTGLPLIGKQSLSLVNYTMFSGTGPIDELYYQAGNLQLQKKTEFVSIYSPNAIPDEVVQQLNALTFLNDEHIAIVHGTNPSSNQGKRILFTKDLSLDAINQDVILSQLQLKYNFGESPAWMSEVVASFLTNTTVGGEKAQEMVMTLKNNMTEEQLSDWKNKLTDLEGSAINAQLLDEQLTKVFENDTKYFQMNLTTDTVYPLLFNDNRQILINTRLVDDVDVIFIDDEILYSADSILKHLGYEAKVGEKGYYVNNEKRKFRFPQNHDFYVYNDQRYNTVSHPIKEVAGTYYIEESWLQKLFFVEINKRKDSISIKSIDPLQ